MGKRTMNETPAEKDTPSKRELSTCYHHYALYERGKRGDTQFLSDHTLPGNSCRMSATDGIPSFEEVKRPIPSTITTTEFYCARVEKCHIGEILKALGTRIPMTNDVVVRLRVNG